MSIVRSAAAAILFALVGAAHAVAVTPEELKSLAAAGLGDEVLLALIETTGVSSPVGADQALALGQAGVTDRVIAAAVRASQPESRPSLPPEEPSCAACGPNLAVIGGPPEPLRPAITREVYYMPWVVTVPRGPGRSVPARPYFEGDRGFGRFINDGTAARPVR